MNFDAKKTIAKTFSCLFLLYELFAGESNSLFAQHVSVKDIVAGYKTNAALFQGSRVCYKQTSESMFDDYSHEGVYDYWSEGQDFLLRGGNSRELGSPEKILSGQFSKNLTSLDLETIYGNIPIISYDSMENLGYRWVVSARNANQENNEKNSGKITKNTAPIWDSDDFYCPPFLPFTLDNLKKVFPTDAFFSCMESDLFLLGTQVVDGEEYYILESRVMHPECLYQFQDDDDEGMNFCSICRAWIDIKRGCIPIRIEYLSALSKSGQLIDYTPSLQFSESHINSSVFEVQETQKVGAGFYPVRVSHRFMGISKEGRERLRKAFNEDNNDGDSVDVGGSLVYEVQLENRWEVSKIILDVAVDRETLALPFPKGTIIFDDRSENVRVAGMTQKEYETMLVERSRSFGVVPDSGMVLPDPNSKQDMENYIPRAPSGWRTAFLIIGINLVILGFIIRYFLMSRKRSKE